MAVIKGASHKARDLSPELRRAAETLLGQALEEDETVIVRASKGYIVKEAPTGEAREKAFRRLLGHMDELAGRVKDVPAEDLDSLIEEAWERSRHEH
jgi:hypothetical protein